MKYFTKEVCCFGLQAGDPKRSAEAKRRVKYNAQQYTKNLNKILPRMPCKSRSFFKRNCQLADGSIQQITFSNIYLQSKTKNIVEISVIHPENGKQYVLKYRNIRKCIFEYPSDAPMYYEENKCGFGKWFADELTMSKDGWFTHEILFDTGASLLLEFRSFSYVR